MEVTSAKYTSTGSVLVVIDGETHFVEPESGNWVAAALTDYVNTGGQIEPYVPDPADLIERFRVAINEHIEATARSKRYEGSVSLATYATPAEPNEEWRAEAYAFVNWRSNVWAYAYAQFDEVMSGGRTIPTVDEFIGELPVIEWPPEQED